MSSVRRMFAVVAALLAMCVILGGCTKTEPEKPTVNTDFQVFCYAINSDATSMYKVEYRFQSASTSARIAELLQELAVTDEDNNRYSVIPGSVRVEDWYLTEEGVLDVSFNGEYSQISSIREALLRTGVVLTLTQLSDVRGVTFTINGAPLLNRQDEPVGIMTASMFANNVGDPTEVIEVKLCFVNSTKNGLTTINRLVFPDDYEPLEQYLVQYLIAGPTEEEVADAKQSASKPIKAIPLGTRILHVLTKNNVCYVDLSSEFMDSDRSIAPLVLMHSVADTLIRNCDYIDSVVITVDGKILSTYRNTEVPSIFKTADLLITDN